MNAQVVEALKNAAFSQISGQVENVERQIKESGDRVRDDLFANHGRGYRKSNATVAALLADSVTFRQFALSKGFNLTYFDQQLILLRDAWKAHTQTPGIGITLWESFAKSDNQDPPF